ncbi:peptide ABC transporter substrate-binding protein [bacterium]|nr:MAG: peptide ABC transporter substrate-binding protein [bacterium]
MYFIKKIFWEFSSVERKWFFTSLSVLILSLATQTALSINERGIWVPITGGSYREGFLGQPMAINPILSNNPIDQEISSIVFSRLSDLLSTYEVSSDGRTYNLKLKEGLRWDDGQPLTSDDVIFTIRTVQNPEVRSPFSKSWQGVAAERGSELQIKLTLPLSYAFFQNNIKWLPIIPKHIFGAIPTENFRLSDYNFEPVGSGPYKFKDFSKRKDGFISQYHFVPNENFYGEKPYIRDFYFTFFQDPEDLYRALRIHDVNGFGSATPVSFDISSVKGVTEEKLPMPDYYAVFFNQNSNPLLKDKNIRTALASAIDKKRILDEALGGKASIVSAPGFASMDSMSGNNSNYNPDSAKQIISDFKTRNKNERINITLTVPDVGFLNKTAELIKNDWRDAGVDQVNINVFNPSDPTKATIKSRDYEMLLFGNILENPVDLFPFWHSSQRLYPGFNLALYQNSKADNLFENIRQTNDQLKQKDLLNQAQNMILSDLPAVFLFSLPYTYIHTSDLGGFNPDLITTPSEIFKNVNKWYVAQVKIIK